MSASANTPMAGQGEPAGFKPLDVDYGQVQWPAGAPAPDKHIKPMAPGMLEYPGDGDHA